MRPVEHAARAVVITGGTRGIGAGIARAFLRAGAQVLVCGRSEPTAAGPPGPDEPGQGAAPGAAGPKGRDGVPVAGGQAAAFARADVRDPEQAHRLIGTALDLFGRVDVVVSNAGGSPYADAAAASPRLHARIIELNLVAPLHVAQSANAVMQGQSGGGSIIMVGSVSGTRPSPGTAAYGAAKAGLHHLVTSLAVEWGPKVRVNSVVPGFVATETGSEHYGGAAGMAAVTATVPLRRLATPDDVAATCLFLSSPQASYVSGAALMLHGGGEPPAFLAAVQGSVYAP
jgi:NAD(P)-dependent dehydrogenase (short-subunit alcohol dehydrogenase family)